VKKLLTGIAAFTIAVGCAVAQASDSYDPYGRLMLRTVNGAGYSPDGRLLNRSVVRGNISRTYDANGHLRVTGIRRGNTLFQYDRSGRLIGRGDLNSGRLYDAHGRHIGTATR